MKENYQASLMENIITILAHDDTHGKIVAGLVDTSLFEGDYRLLAERCVDYWRKHSEAPKQHTADLVSDILEDPHDRRARSLRQTLSAMYELAESINVTYVVDQLKTFTRMQKIKAAILKSAEEINAKQELAIEEIEVVWNKLLRTQDDTFDQGMTLTDVDRIVNYVNFGQSEFVMGIKELDSNFVVPARGTVMLLLGATGLGKTWMMVHIGKQALLQRKKVLHISLEMKEEAVILRYYQSMFSVSKREDRVEVTTLHSDTFGRVDEFTKESVEPEFTFNSPFLREELEARINWTRTKFSNLLVKRFSGLTVDKLRAYLDNLEATKNFIPDLIILDYWGLMRVGGGGADYRINLGSAYKDFRDMLIERNIAGVTAQQGSKEGARSQTMNATHTAEDWSLPQTSDMVITYSQTDTEKRFGLARIFVAKAREENDKFTVLISQNYKIGQFLIDSSMMGSKYWEMIDDLPIEDIEEDDE